MHSDQISISKAQATSLIAEQAPQWQGLEVSSPRTSGTDNAIFRLGDSLAARFPLSGSDPKTLEDRLRTEAAAMAEFHRVSAFPGPEPLMVGAPGHGYPLPWNIQTWIEGDVLTPTSHAGSFEVATDLASLIHSLRAAGSAGRRFDGKNRGGELADHDAWVRECIARSQGLLDTRGMHALWAEFRDLPRGIEPDVMSHTDLIPSNLLVSNGRLVGAIDTGEYRAADPALDLVCAWHVLSDAPREALRRDLGCNALEWERGKAWAFEQAIGLVWYYLRTNPTMSHLGRTTISRLVEAQREGR